MSKLAVLASGTGSLLEAMIEDGLPIALVHADRHCRAIDEIAPKAELPRVLIKRTFGARFDRADYTNCVVETLRKEGVTHIAMAGYMTVFAPSLFDHFGGKILNTHPSLLPSFKGDHAVRDALQFGAKVTGFTIHVATPELDDGTILEQIAVRVQPDDTVATLHERIKRQERIHYPRIIREFIA